ncbi:MAG: hypothetical protein KA163_13955 [Bacteroidia bacterium]|nr:hypothetical protein [Bacteroidia bacterium]
MKTIRILFLIVVTFSLKAQTTESLKNFTWTETNVSSKSLSEDSIKQVAESKDSIFDLSLLFRDVTFNNLLYAQMKRGDAFYLKYDTLEIKVQPDPWYEGTEEELKEQIANGTVKRTFNINNQEFVILEKIEFIGNNNFEQFYSINWPFLGLIIVIAWFVITSNKKKIKKHFEELGYEIVYESFDPFADTSWIGERSFTAYKIIYYNNEKKLCEAIVKTGPFTSVQIVDEIPAENASLPKEEITINAIQKKQEKIETLKSEIEELKETLEETTKKTDQIIKKYTLKDYQCSGGVLTIEQEYEMPNVGEKALFNGKSAPDGKYKIGFLQNIIVKDGKVSEDESA